MNLVVITPQVVIVVSALLILICGLLIPRIKRLVLASVGLLGIILAALFSARLWGQDLSGFSGMLSTDTYGLAFNFIFLAGAAVAVLLSINRTEGEYLPHVEYCFLVLMACCGMMFMASGLHLFIIFIGLEILSVSLYALAG